MTSPVPAAAVVVTTHREGRLMIPTVRGLARAIAHAHEHGIGVEVVIVRDRADRRTVEQVDSLVAEGALELATATLVVDVDHGDLGLSRNSGIAASSAPVVGVLDADNLPSAAWITEGLARLAAAGEPAIVHPERIIRFGERLEVWPLTGTDSPAFQPGTLAWSNAWDAFALMDREVWEAHPYRECRPWEGFGPEDWAWNCETVAAGVPHLTVPGTSLYYWSRTSASLAEAHRGSLLPRNDLLRSKELAAVEAPRLAARLVGASPAGRGARSVIGAVRGASPVVDRAVGLAGRAARAAARVVRPADDAAVPAPLAALAPEEVADWQDAHRLQPLLRTPVERHLASYVVDGADHDERSVPDRAAYWTAIDELPERVDVLFVGLWVRASGGDRMLLEHIHAVRRLRPDASIALITTEEELSEHLHLLPEGVTVVELGRFRLWPEFLEQVLAMVCAQLRPETIHINNAERGFWMMERWGVQIARHSRVYAQTFVVDRFDDGSEWSFLYNRSRDYFDRFTGILTDSEAFVDHVVETQGIPRELFTVHTVVDTVALAPSAEARAGMAAPAGRTLRLLWVGRFDLQKRLDRLADISEALAAEGADVEITIIGEPLVGSDPDWQDHLDRALAGVAVRGEAYRDGFPSAHPERYDALLMTSDYEGVPMVMLEAMASGLPVIAPLVGGVGEALDANTGLPVDPEEGIAGYLDRVHLLRDAPDEVAARVAAARSRLEQTSSRAAFDRTLERLPGYLPRVTGPGAWARLGVRWFASPEAAERLAARDADVVVYTGSNGHSNFGDILQTKNILAYWAGRAGRRTTLVMPAYAALPAGRSAELEAWYPADDVVFVSTTAVDVRGAGLVEIPAPAGGTLVHVVGGGYLNARWGGEHFPVIDAVASGCGAPILFSGLQVDEPALAGFTELARHHRIVSVGLRDHVSHALATEALDVPVRFTFDDLTETFQDWARARDGHVRLDGPTRVAVHMNTSDYAGGDVALDLWRDVLRQVAEELPGCELLLLHAYDDPRLDVRDTLDTVAALAEDMPFSRFEVIDIAKASLEYRFGAGLPDALRPVLDVDLALSSSYHTALFASFMGVPAYLMGASAYFRQKAQLFELPELGDFLRDPGAYRLEIPAELGARRAWLEVLAELP
ncbi:glycosyltransferase [Demequina sp. SYSU T00039]|uniref:D-inositol 3-phosphate glycosyltransferase n=1 Tax=Demequina lignilytica TaxID=3051663 RepID=A0AAW7M835_9MICO|nr:MULTISPECIES: glycosyltransferase [unclassified Demequina]MDN4478447.1 glycosyltransferase [Demequina sp. SYSU T00039-1]MDN4487046.1 glycosyltransferase [Demequina sp. SYSU T00039]